MTDQSKCVDCYAVLRGSLTPCGLYARQKWFSEEGRRHWQRDFEITVNALRQGQDANGLWQNSPLVTIHRLFGLHLTVRAADRQIEAALDALLAGVQHSLAPAEDIFISSEELTGLPFASDRWSHIAIPAILFLSAIFGRSYDPLVLTLYDRMTSGLSGPPLAIGPPSKVHNAFRALVVHPEYATHQATLSVVAWYAQRQTSDGHWGGEIPFYQALNALAHLDSAAADKQCRAAFAILPSRQNADGSWGREQQEWHTFLTLHALRNKGRLSLPPHAG